MANMLQLITKNYFNKKATRLYPVVVREPFERTRGRIILNPSTCILCSLCARKCPADAIIVDRKAEKWELNAFRCITCGECVGACPKKSITMTNERRTSAAEREIVTHHVDVPVPAAKPAAPAAPKPAVEAKKEE